MVHQNAQQELSKNFLVCARAVEVRFGEEQLVEVQQEREEEDVGRNWICGDPEEVDDEDDEDRGYTVRPGLSGGEAVQKVRVVGTHKSGTTIPLGQPLAVRRSPTEAERLTFERLQEAIREGERGLEEHQRNKERRVQQNRTEQCFRRTQ